MFISPQKTGIFSAMFSNDRERIQRLECFTEETELWHLLPKYDAKKTKCSPSLHITGEKKNYIQSNTVIFLVNFLPYLFRRGILLVTN